MQQSVPTQMTPSGGVRPVHAPLRSSRPPPRHGCGRDADEERVDVEDAAQIARGGDEECEDLQQVPERPAEDDLGAQPAARLRNQRAVHSQPGSTTKTSSYAT